MNIAPCPDFFRLSGHNHDTRLYPQRTPIGYGKVIQAETWVFLAPTRSSARQTQYTFGEPLLILEQQQAWLHTQSLRDGYCGWIMRTAVEPCQESPAQTSHTTRFIAPITAKADLKSEPLGNLPPDSLFTPDDEENGYLHIADVGWIDHRHTMPQNTCLDPCDTAEYLLGKSYVWGGRGSAGLDCSALAQLCYRWAGRHIPRDADLQAHYLRQHHQEITAAEIHGGDLIFIPGHVMLAIDQQTIIHANGYHMRVVKEPLTDALARYHATGNPTLPTYFRW